MPHAEGESREITLSLAPRGSTRADPQVEFFGLKKGQLMATLKTHCSVSSVPGRGSELRTPNLSSVYFLDPIDGLVQTSSPWMQQFGCAIPLAW